LLIHCNRTTIIPQNPPQTTSSLRRIVSAFIDRKSIEKHIQNRIAPSEYNANSFPAEENNDGAVAQTDVRNDKREKR